MKSNATGHEPGECADGARAAHVGDVNTHRTADTGRESTGHTQFDVNAKDTLSVETPDEFSGAAAVP